MIAKVIRLIFKLTPVLALILICFQILIANELAGLGQKVQGTDVRIYELQGENEVLRQQVASASSLATITVMAEKQGFTATPNYVVIGQEEFALQPLH